MQPVAIICQNDTTKNISGSFFSPAQNEPIPITSDPVSPVNNPIQRNTFTARIPIHLLPSNKILEYFPWEIETGLKICPYTGMLVRAHRGLVPVNSTEEEPIDKLRNFPSPHCSVECECLATGDYQCKSICPSPPNDMDFCLPVAVPGECCHKYVCDDDLDASFPGLQFPEPKKSSTGNAETILMCLPRTLLPDSVCHSIYPKAFSGHLGPKGICFGYSDIRCAFLQMDDNNNNEISSGSGRENNATQTIFFQTTVNGTVFSTNVPLKKSRNKLRPR